jgi:hypothetical protein
MSVYLPGAPLLLLSLPAYHSELGIRYHLTSDWGSVSGVNGFH